jgi:hypothetical protein
MWPIEGELQGKLQLMEVAINGEFEKREVEDGEMGEIEMN